MNIRGIPTAAYQVLHLLTEVGYAPPPGYPLSRSDGGYPRWVPLPSRSGGTWCGVHPVRVCPIRVSPIRVPPSKSGGGGYLRWVPPIRVPPRGTPHWGTLTEGYPPVRVPPLGCPPIGYPSHQGTPCLGTPHQGTPQPGPGLGTPPPCLDLAQVPYPPRCGQTDGWMDGQTRVKTLPSRRTTYAVGKKPSIMFMHLKRPRKRQQYESWHEMFTFLRWSRLRYNCPVWGCYGLIQVRMNDIQNNPFIMLIQMCDYHEESENSCACRKLFLNKTRATGK